MTSTAPSPSPSPSACTWREALEDHAAGRARWDLSALVDRAPQRAHRTGSAVMSGALNGTRAFVLEATASAADSQYAAIVSLVQQVAESRAPMVRLADRYAVPFTAVAYLTAGLACWLPRDPVRFAEVLVVATPCPLLTGRPERPVVMVGDGVNALRPMKPSPHKAERLGDLAAAPARGERRAVPS